MMTEEQIRKKIGNLLFVVKELELRHENIMEGSNHMDLESLAHATSELDSIRNQLLEIYGNIRAFKLVLGEVDDLDFALRTGASAIEDLGRDPD
jgi:hypothetical protein